MLYIYILKLFRSILNLSIGVFFSRISGLVRDIVIANYLGSTIFADIFFTAFKIPNFFRKIFAEGAVNSAFIPIFAKKINNGKDAVIHFARNIFSILTIATLLFVILSEIFMPYIIHIFAPGFAKDQNIFNLTVKATRIAFPYLFLISLTSLIAAILNSFEKFFLIALRTVLLNIIVIAFILIAKDYESTKIFNNAIISIPIAGLAQFFWLFFLGCKEKIIIYPILPKITNTTKKFFVNFFHSFISSGVVQINTIIDSIFATLAMGGVSTLYYTARIYNLPLALIGTSITTVILPKLSKSLKSQNTNESFEIQEKAILFSCYFGIPSSFGIYALSQLIIQTIFERGVFTFQDTIRVSTALKIYCISLPFIILYKILQSMFFARENTKTPMNITIQGLFINVILNCLTYKTLGIYGIVLSSVISEIYTTIYLFIQLYKQKILIITDNLILKVLKILYSSIIMFGTIIIFDKLLSHINISNIIKLMILIGFPGVIFLLLSVMIGVVDRNDINELIRKK